MDSLLEGIKQKCTQHNLSLAECVEVSIINSEDTINNHISATFAIPRQGYEDYWIVSEYMDVVLPIGKTYFTQFSEERLTTEIASSILHNLEVKQIGFETIH